MKEQQAAELHVAIVDESRFFIRLMRSMLRSFGIRNVSEAATADQALQLAVRHHVDVLFVDYHLAPTNGLELIHRIRSDPSLSWRGALVFCVTAHAELSIVTSAVRIGADDILVKPFSAADIHRKLAVHIANPLPRLAAPGYFGPDRRRRIDADFDGPDRRVRQAAK